MTFQDDDNQNNDDDQNNNNQQSSSQNTTLAECNAVIHQQELDVELAKLEIRKLKLLTAHELSIPDTDSDQNNIVCDFKNKIATKSSKLSFKLDDMNYNFWHDEALAQTLSIKIKNILNNREIECSDLTDDDVKI